jgi:hypothetical protein
VSPGTALAQNGTPGGKDDAKKARADKSHKDAKKDGDSERRSEKPKKDTTTPNQGETSKVLTVSGMSCPSPVPGSKVEGGLGTTITVSSSLPIARVTLKSGNSATVVGASFSADFKSATITLSKDVSNYIVWTCASSGGEKPDACPNLEGQQGTVPTGFVKDAQGNCVRQKEDVCPNLEGQQGTVPKGFVKDAQGNCVKEKEDVCPNLEGVQTTVPTGMVKDAQGNCVKPKNPDACPNLEGQQGTVPSGMIKDAQGNCVKPQDSDVCLISRASRPPFRPAWSRTRRASA